jgi:hypothetical protein
MKTKILFLPILALTATLSVSAQQIEHDDMYFTSKDRAKEKAAHKSAVVKNNDIVARGIKSTDQYSGRAINPEYTSRLNANSNTVQGSSNPYFDSDYQSKSTSTSGNYSDYSNPYYGNSFNNPYYGSSWNSPYSNMYGSNNLYGYSGMYGTSMYSPYSSFYSAYSPYGYTSGLSIGLMFGSAMYSPYGYNSMMYGYGAGYGGYYGYPYSGPGGYYPSTVIVNNGDVRNSTVYGKRNSRGSSFNNSVMSNNNTVSPSTSQSQETQYSIPASGRTSSTQQYYQPNWRNNTDAGALNNSGLTNGSGNSRSQSLGTQNPSWNSGTTSRPTQNPGWNTTRQSVPSNNSFGTPSTGSSPSWGGGGGVSGGSSGGGSSQPSRGR